ncbi:MAG: caspase family protein [Bacteroidetes bacterium]|nr:caspase family protein [Bacteroidota bacterium]
MTAKHLKRKAIILGSPYPQDSKYHLRGVAQDVVNFRKFLMSSAGGAWKRGEIHHGTHIKSSVVHTIQRLCKDVDIAVIFYSGHGFMRGGENYININPRESLNVEHLYTRAKRQTTLVDACRTDYSYEHLEGIGDIGMYFDNTRPDLGRALFDYYLERSPEENFTMFSSSENQPSQDTENGGLFTYSLLNKVSDWTLRTDKLCLPAHVAFTHVERELNQRFVEQEPTYHYSGDIIPTIPFGVSPRSYLRNYLGQNDRVKSRGMTIRTLS